MLNIFCIHLCVLVEWYFARYCHPLVESEPEGCDPEPEDISDCVLSESDADEERFDDNL